MFHIPYVLDTTPYNFLTVNNTLIYVHILLIVDSWSDEAVLSPMQLTTNHTQGPISRMIFFFIIIQIRWKFYSALIQVDMKWSQWNFSHGTTAVGCVKLLPYNGVTLTPIFHRIWTTMEKIVPEMGPRSERCLSCIVNKYPWSITKN